VSAFDWFLDSPSILAHFNLLSSHRHVFRKFPDFELIMTFSSPPKAGQLLRGSSSKALPYNGGTGGSMEGSQRFFVVAAVHVRFHVLCD
jgi:hypothetical protein